MHRYNSKYQHNRRRYNRVKFLGGLKLIVQENIFFTEKIKDISAKGIKISHSGKYQFDPYDKFSFEIPLPNSGTEGSINGTAEVIRTIPYEEVGLMISSIDEANQNKLNQFIETASSQ
jgi:c-di-GMP-binding flagellar brake protein YcgR